MPARHVRDAVHTSFNFKKLATRVAVSALSGNTGEFLHSPHQYRPGGAGVWQPHAEQRRMGGGGLIVWGILTTIIAMASSSLHHLVFNDCRRRLLRPEYRWLTRQSLADPLPAFKVPEDPSADIKFVLAWKPIVENISNGMEMHDYRRSRVFRNGQQTYKHNLDVMMLCANSTAFVGSGDDQRVLDLLDPEVSLALHRWQALYEACHEARMMMWALAYNKW